MTGEPPSDAGTAHVTVAPSSRLVAFTPTGAPGTVTVATGVAFTATDTLLCPALFTAITQK